MNVSKQNSFNLSGKTALVTGASGLLGAEHCRALAEAGAQVIATDIRESQTDFRFEKMDVTQLQSIEKVYEKLNKEGISVDILVNNAAIDPKVTSGPGIKSSSRLENFSVEDWDFQIRVGLTGAFLCSRVFGSAMAQRGSGSIVNIASDLSVIAPDQRLYRQPNLQENEQPVKPVTYSVIKTGLIGLTRYLATYWAQNNVRVNALSPGGVFNQQNEGFVKRVSELIPMGRMARREEYRSALLFLASDASSYMTGQNLVVDGGRSII